MNAATCINDDGGMFNVSSRPIRESLAFLAALLLVFWVLILTVVVLDDAAVMVDDMYRPDVLLYTMLAVIVMIPACWVAVRWAGRRSFGSLLSAENRFRWGVALRALPLVLVVLLAGNVAFLAVSDRGSLSSDATSLVLLAIIALAVPLQATAEELVFRGLLPQVVGSWVKSPWLMYGIPLALFVAGHSYNWVGLIDIAVFAACLSLLAHRTRGIEIPIVLHVCNNLFAFGMGALGVQNLNQVAYPWVAVLVSSGTTIIVTALILADEKLMAMCARAEEPAEEENAPRKHTKHSEERGQQGGAKANARPGKQQRAGRHPNPAPERKQQGKQQNQRS